MNKKLNPFIIAAATIIVAVASCKSKKQQASANQLSVEPSEQQARSTSQVEPAVGLNLGNLAPAIDLKDPSGKVISLSSLKGKVVLIDFWASWCGPCRFENPTVVKTYRQYKDKKLKGGKGFTVYSVSLDMNENAWKKAIEQDSLVWQYHVSDLKGWGSEVVPKYAIAGIPTNYLINDKGIIIDKNLRGEALIAALEKLVK